MRKKPTPSPPSSDKPGSTTPRVAAKEITSVVFGGQLIVPWYPSSYPSKLLGDANFKNGRLYVCEHCFKYTPDVARALGHQVCCYGEKEWGEGRRLMYEGDRSFVRWQGERCWARKCIPTAATKSTKWTEPKSL